jgi:hypothetical protein
MPQPQSAKRRSPQAPQPRSPIMSRRLRNFVGTILLLVLVVVYALAIMATAPRILPEASGVIEFFFYLVAGLIWVFPAGLIILWMARPDAASRG